jgi:GT2 family glycosyltransferase
VQCICSVYPKKGYRTTHIHNSLEESNCEFIGFKNTDYVNGSAMVVPVESFEHVGYMREDFFLYYEETEWCMRLKDHNKAVIVSTHQKVYHKPSAKGSKYNFYMNRNRIWLSKIRGEYVYLALIFSLYSYFLQLISLKSVKKSYSSSTLKGVLKGILIGILTSPKRRI